MTLRVRRGRVYGDDHRDLQADMRDYASRVYPASHFADARCHCDSTRFAVTMDDAAGVAIRVCNACGYEHPIGDSCDFLDEAAPEPCICTCNRRIFEVSVGVALYEDSEDVKWLYLGLRCIACGLLGVYGDWKNEFEDYRQLLDRV